MTFRLQVNRPPFSPALARRYLAGLNQSFPGWGDQAWFDWRYARSDSPCQSDLVVAEQDGNPVAGLSVIYRNVICGGRLHLVGIMSGAWTDPGVRRGGCFTTLLETCGDVARSRGACQMIGWVRGDRPSVGVLGRYCDQILDAGFVTFTARAHGKTGTAGAPIALELARDSLVARRVPGDRIGFAYTPAQWCEQMVAMRLGLVARRFDDGMTVLIQPDSSGCRVVDVAFPSSAALIANARRLADEFGACTFYTCDSALLAAARSEAARIQAGRFYAKLLRPSPLDKAQWIFSDGDRM